MVVDIKKVIERVKGGGMGEDIYFGKGIKIIIFVYEMYIKIFGFQTILKECQE